MPRRSPLCPDCSSHNARPIIYGEPAPDLALRADRGEVVLGGCVLAGDDPAWDCPDCGRRFGQGGKARAKVAPRGSAEWVELIRTMLPQPVLVDETGVLLGGDPVTVMVRVDEDAIEILEAGIEWVQTHTPERQGRPFAKVPLDTPATRVAQLIAGAWGKRISRYCWCPRCHEVVEPEHSDSGKSGICQSCATKVLGIIY